MNGLGRLPNIGKVLASELSDAGIETMAELTEVGSVRATFRFAANGSSVCSNRVYALEGAICGIRWHAISQRERVDPRARFERAVRDESSG